MKLITLTVFFVCNILTSHAQTSSISGNLQDDTNKKPVRGATISLLLRRDSTLVKNALSDSAGYFNFSNIVKDSFIVTINAIDYQQYVSLVVFKDSSIDLGTLSLIRQG